MDKYERLNCIDFIEFPVDNVDALNQTKGFYNKVFGWSYKN
jgi:predicted enzyme related to lactoylglutathione lyase